MRYILTISALILVACGTDPSEAFDYNGSYVGNGPQVSGTQGLGELCFTDADCQAGSICLDSWVPGDRYCSRSCDDDTPSDCAAMNEAPHNFWLDTYGIANNWNADYLTRGLGCYDHKTGGSYCGFMCPPNAAVVYEDGYAAGCSCLPNFRNQRRSDGSMECVWQDRIQCSLLTPCTLANTAVGECSQGDYTCIVNDNLEGYCFDWVEPEAIEACVAEDFCGYDSCDSGCLSSCGTSSACLNSCCASSC